MDWRIQATDPTLGTNLKGVLEASRDAWVATTPQESDLVAGGALADADEAIVRSHNEARAPAVRMRNALIAERSKTLDAVHTEVVRQMNAAIASAVSMVAAMGDKPVRVSILGHYKTVARDGIYERVSIQIDHAAHG
jgi:hypothetical protein